jgi:hypothetical protein
MTMRYVRLLAAITMTVAVAGVITNAGRTTAASPEVNAIPAGVPAEKAAIVKAERSFQTANSGHQASTEELARETIIPQVDEPPVTGLVAIDAPMPAAEFTPTGKAYSSIDHGQWVTVWVGYSAADPAVGKVLVISSALNGAVPAFSGVGADPAISPAAVLVAVPLAGSPLAIEGTDARGRVVISSSSGKRVSFDVTTGAFDN